ncbi:hypothetical protein CYMTET_45286 [Cymbomonas tetramitiformis]|uniref:SET domain-containing protein n=1 Tax=Cymbomonas tetramitiformis TaxID=36881 RepID=A0AAE0BYJ8_9CHLO|nr:hypothetical protein CYMTET_45286 [Cymbomonas tetramitiformis]
MSGELSLANRDLSVNNSQMLSAKPRQPRHPKGQLKQSAICFAQPHNDISDTSKEALELRRIIRKRGQVACGALLFSSISALAVLGKFPGGGGAAFTTVAVLGMVTFGANVAGAGEFEVQFGDTVVSVEIVDGRVYIQWGFPPKEGPLVSPGDVVVRETGDVRGRGAYVANPIEEGTFLGDYEGELLDNAEYFKRYPSGVADYCIGVDPDYVLDGVEVAKGDEFTIAHINHSRLRANVVRRARRKERRISFFASRDLAVGEELLLDYGRKYWQGREDMEIE